MTVAVVVLGIVAVALAVCLIISNRQLHAAHSELIRAVIAKDGRELALMNRAEKRNVAPPEAGGSSESPPLTAAALTAQIARDNARIEGLVQPSGFDGY